MKKVSYIWTSKIDKSCEVQEVTMCDEWAFEDWLNEQGCKWEKVMYGTYRVMDIWDDLIGYYDVLREERI